MSERPQTHHGEIFVVAKHGANSGSPAKILARNEMWGDRPGLTTVLHDSRDDECNPV